MHVGKGPREKKGKRNCIKKIIVSEPNDIPEQFTIDCKHFRGQGTQIIQKQFFLCGTDVRAIGKLIPGQLMRVIGTFAEGTYEDTRITQKNSCQKALCNRCPVQLGN